MSTARFCHLFDLPERTWRRWQARARAGGQPKGPWPARHSATEVTLRHALAHPAWGHRKVWAMVRHDGHRVSEAAVLRLLRNEGSHRDSRGLRADRAEPAHRRAGGGQQRRPENLDARSQNPLARAKRQHPTSRVKPGSGPVDVLASSGGAVNRLGFVAAHPDVVRTLVAHEPPLVSALPDHEAAFAAIHDVRDTYQRDGLGPGMAKFLGLIMHSGEVPRRLDRSAGSGPGPVRVADGGRRLAGGSDARSRPHRQHHRITARLRRDQGCPDPGSPGVRHRVRRSTRATRRDSCRRCLRG